MSEKPRIACEWGEYKDFSGIIFWGANEGVVEKATFNLYGFRGDGRVVFFGGDWLNGVVRDMYWVGGSWYGGIWYSGIWNRGNFRGGIWKDGTWVKGVWHDGVWKSGVWKRGIWKDGAWFGGVDRNGKFHKTSPVRWRKVK